MGLLFLLAFSLVIEKPASSSMALWGGAVLISVGGLFQFLAFASGRRGNSRARCHLVAVMPSHVPWRSYATVLLGALASACSDSVGVACAESEAQKPLNDFDSLSCRDAKALRSARKVSRVQDLFGAIC